MASFMAPILRQLAWENNPRIAPQAMWPSTVATGGVIRLNGCHSDAVQRHRKVGQPSLHIRKEIEMLRTRSLSLVAALLVSSVLTVAAVTHAQPPPPARGDRMFSRLQKNLGLSDAQVTQIRGIFQQHRDAYRQLGQTQRQARTELRQLALNAGDASAIAAKKAEIAQLTAQGLDLRVQTLQQIGPILTQEQRDKLAQMGPWAMGREGHRHHKPPQPS
jgi:Spy/CpxP family protein refolding chaperone